MKQWTFDDVMDIIRKAMEELGTDRLPTCAELDKFGLYGNTLKQFGGLKNISRLTGIPLAQAKHYTKNEMMGTAVEKWKGMPSRAAEIEAEQRKGGKHYSDWQKAETLRLAGRISV